MPLSLPPEPVGVIKMYVNSSTVPVGYLLCNGQAVSRTAYAALYGLCGTQYGSGDGSTTFNLPDLRGRAPMGFDSGQTAFQSVGLAGGATTHLHSVPAHTHPLSDNAQAAILVTTATPFLAMRKVGATAWTATHTQANPAAATSSASQSGGAGMVGATDNSLAGVSGVPTTATSGLPPYLTLMFIIKT